MKCPECTETLSEISKDTLLVICPECSTIYRVWHDSGEEAIHLSRLTSLNIGTINTGHYSKSSGRSLVGKTSALQAE